MLNEKGLLSEIPIVKLLLIIFEEELTGILYIKRSDIVKALYFRNGELVWASSNSELDKIENILVSKGLVKSIIIEELKEENKLVKPIGKLLLERGVITLGEFIKFTKEQLENIIISVLKWREGEYRYVKEPPPDNQFNLDFNIMSFVFKFIVNDLDESVIIEEVGSFRTKLFRTFDEKKLEKYSLTDKQKELLVIFNDQINLEDFLSKHSKAQRGSLLKIVYFFLMAGILTKDEFELPEEDQDVKKEDFKDDLDEYKIGAKQENLFEINEYKEEGKDKNQVKKEKDFDIQKMISEEEKQGKSFNFIILFVVLIFIIGTIILYLLLSESKKEDKIDKSNKENIINVEEMKPVIKKDNKKSDKSQINNEKNIQKREENKTKTNFISEKAEVSDALGYFKRGEYEIAAKVWKKELKRKKVKYSILLEYDRLEESVLKAYSNIKNKNRFFIMIKKKNGRIGFLVMWGMFDTEKDAGKALRELPVFFQTQKPPARVFDLEQYIE